MSEWSACFWWVDGVGDACDPVGGCFVEYWLPWAGDVFPAAGDVVESAVGWLAALVLDVLCLVVEVLPECYGFDADGEWGFVAGGVFVFCGVG